MPSQGLHPPLEAKWPGYANIIAGLRAIQCQGQLQVGSE